MKSDLWMPLYVGDYLADTMHLTAEQHGMYLLLIMAYWRHGGPLPDDPSYLASIAKASEQQWQQHANRIAEFFVVGGGKWTHKRIEAELLASRERRANRAKSAKAGASARWHANSTAASMLAVLPTALPPASEQQCFGQVQSQSQCTHTLPPTPQGEEAVIPTREEVETYGDMVGVPAEYCAHYHATCSEKHRWLSGNGRLIDWRREMKRWWESDRVKPRWAKGGAPRTSEEPRVTTASKAYALKTQLEAIDAEITTIRNRGFEDAFGLQIKPEDKPRLKELKAKRAAIMQQLTRLDEG